MHFHSHHPTYVKRSVIYSQALRYNMLSDSDEDLQRDLYALTKTLLARRYPLNMINEEILKALQFSQKDLINTPRQIKEQKSHPLPLVMPFTPTGLLIAKSLHDLWPRHDPEVNEIWNRPPINAFQRTTNIKDSLVHTDLL